MWYTLYCDNALAFCSIHTLIIAISHPGMTVEVLGTVIGTGIQGQIVGMANTPCIPVGNDLNSTFRNSGSEVNISQPDLSLDKIVSPRARRHCNDVLRMNWIKDMYYPCLEMFNTLPHPYSFCREMLTWLPQGLFVPFISSVPSYSSVVWRNAKVRQNLCQFS